MKSKIWGFLLTLVMCFGIALSFGQRTLAQNDSGVTGFVERLYEQTLQREADADGLNSWVNVLTSGKESGAKVAQGFIDSNEFKSRNLSDEDYITILYRTFFDREPDTAGLNAWIAVLNDGLSRLHVFKGFAESDEFTKICNSYGIIRGNAELTAPMDQNEGVTKFIVRCYRLCLGREADEGGLNSWCTQILSGANTAKEAAYGFVFSNEFQSKNLSNEDFVKTMYRVFMDREADSAGLSSWMNVLAQGQSRWNVFNGFADSLEFQDICSTYGVNSGSGMIVGSDPGITQQPSVPEPNKDIVLVDSGWSSDKSGNYTELYYSVKIHNPNTDKNVPFPTVVITAKDSSGKILKTNEQVLSCIAAGDTIFYGNSVLYEGDQPQNVDISVYYDKDMSDFYDVSECAKQSDFVISNVSENSGRYNKAYTGEIRNNSQYDFSNVAISVIYKLNGKMVGGECGYVRDVKSNSTKAFEIHSSADIDYDSYEIHAIQW